MDHYNKVAELLSYGLDKEEIMSRLGITRSRVNGLISEIRDRFFEDEKNGWTLVISQSGVPTKIPFSV